MTFNLSSIMTMIKARQHKYTHRKMIGRDPKTNRIRYRYYYAEHHGGGITSAKFEEGSAFKLTYKGRRGHFHVQRTEGDKVFVKHDGRPNAKEVEMTKSELRALLKAQHETIETKKREKAQEARRKGRKKRKGTKRKSSPKKTTAPAQETPSADNFETMPESDTRLGALKSKLDQGQKLRMSEIGEVLSEVNKAQDRMSEAASQLYSIMSGEYNPAMLEGGGKLVTYQGERRDASENLERHFDFDTIHQESIEKQRQFIEAAQSNVNVLNKLREDIARKLTAPPEQRAQISSLKAQIARGEPLKKRDIAVVISEVDRAQAQMGEAAVILNTITNSASYNPAMLEGAGDRDKIERRDAGDRLIDQFDIAKMYKTADLQEQTRFLDAAQSNINLLNKLKVDIGKRLRDPDNFETMPESDTASLDSFEDMFRGLNAEEARVEIHFMDQETFNRLRNAVKVEREKIDRATARLEEAYNQAEEDLKNTVIEKQRIGREADQAAKGEKKQALKREEFRLQQLVYEKQSVVDERAQARDEATEQNTSPLMERIGRIVEQKTVYSDPTNLARFKDIFIANERGIIPSSSFENLTPTRLEELTDAVVAEQARIKEATKDTREAFEGTLEEARQKGEDIADLEDELNTSTGDRKQDIKRKIEALEKEISQILNVKRPKAREDHSKAVKELYPPNFKEVISKLTDERLRRKKLATSPAQAKIKQANDLDKPTARGTRPKNATKADKELIEKLKDTITNTTQRGDKYHEARRLTVELQLAQSLKRYKDGHPTKGETATKESIYQIRRELRDRLKELTTGM